jgi:hypothetical protein
MDNYSAGTAPPPVGKSRMPRMTVDKVCKLLNAAQPLVWAFAIVFGLLSITLTVRYLWKRKGTVSGKRSSAEMWKWKD